jgi:hypothetical protein
MEKDEVQSRLFIQLSLSVQEYPILISPQKRTSSLFNLPNRKGVEVPKVQASGKLPRKESTTLFREPTEGLESHSTDSLSQKGLFFHL